MLASRRMPQRQTLESAVIPAPVGGMNTVDAGNMLGALKCTYAYNLIGGEYGLRSRLGYQEWVANLSGGDKTVRTMISLAGSASGGGQNKLFACTPSGIWGVTTSGGVTTARANTTAYTVGNYVTSGGETWCCTVAGTSGATVLPSDWVTLTAYVIGDRVVSSGGVYIATANGTSGATTPTGTGTGIADDSVTWDYVSASTAVIDGGVTWRYISSNTSPTQAIAFASSAGKAGFGVWTVATNASGARFILYTDEVNGYYVYTEATDTWAKIAAGVGATQINGVDPANFVHVHIWKSRVWFTQKDTGTAWYTDVNSIYGTVTAFHFGSQMRNGGGLRGLWSWTYDGGSGIDDALVGVSDGGDVVIYKGTDPSSVDTFGLSGRWSVGSIPAGRRICIDSGGELLILTGVGVLSLAKLVAGGSVDDDRLYETRDIANEFSQLIAQYGTLNGWALQIHPTDNALLILVPQTDGGPTIQLAMSFATRGWFRYRDLPILSATVFEGELHFGTADGRVCVNSGYVDNVLLSDSNSYTAVDWSVLTAFRDLGTGTRKQIRQIRPTVVSLSTQPTVAAEARYNYDLTEPDAPATNPSSSSSAWASGVWDTATWGGAYSTSREVRGATGIGVDVAIAIRGKAVSRTVLVKIDVGFIQGGVF